jgi:hypothetical protein
VWVGLDVGKEEHFAEVLDDDGERIFARSVVRRGSVNRSREATIRGGKPYALGL